MERQVGSVCRGGVLMLDGVSVCIWRAGSSWLGHIYGPLLPGDYELSLRDGRVGNITVNAVQVQTGAGQMVSFAGIGALPPAPKPRRTRASRKR